MRMLVALVNFEFGQQHTAEAVLGDHSLDGSVNQHVGLFLPQLGSIRRKLLSTLSMLPWRISPPVNRTLLRVTSFAFEKEF